MKRLILSLIIMSCGICEAGDNRITDVTPTTTHRWTEIHNQIICVDGYKWFITRTFFNGQIAISANQMMKEATVKYSHNLPPQPVKCNE